MIVSLKIKKGWFLGTQIYFLLYNLFICQFLFLLQFSKWCNWVFFLSDKKSLWGAWISILVLIDARMFCRLATSIRSSHPLLSRIFAYFKTLHSIAGNFTPGEFRSPWNLVSSYFSMRLYSWQTRVVYLKECRPRKYCLGTPNLLTLTYVITPNTKVIYLWVLFM